MSISAEFPGNCVTNIHILHDFAEIAYIVCTHAIPANTDSVPDATSSEKILDRLRNAEKQFRQHSILVALDAEKLELFTFYRKVDVVKDQRTILNKFGLVCRLNSCKVSAKWGPARVSELLKPESSHIYTLFTSAILSNIQVTARNNETIIPVGTTVYLVPIPVDGHAQDTGISSFSPEWQLCRVNLQIVVTGQLILTVQNAKNTRLHLLRDLERERNLTSPPPGSLLYLIPSGHVARFVDGLAGTKDALMEDLKSTKVASNHDMRTAIAQIPIITSWLKQRCVELLMEPEEYLRWIQVEIAVLETKDETASVTNRTLTWKRLMWPSTLLYLFKRTGRFRPPSKPSAAETDPLKFILDWYNGSTERNGKLARAQTMKDMEDDGDDDHVFAEEVHFGDQFISQRFGPPAFPASQMIYPTPPEAVITHQTPGMSSIDGLAPTPLPNLNVSQPDSVPFLDQEMADVHEEQGEHIGTGFYDEDLFEEVPDDKFASNAEADEPNWDFFDPPGFEHTDSAIRKPEQARNNSASQEMYNGVTPNGHEPRDDEFPELDNSTISKQGRVLLDDLEPLQTSPDKVETVYDNDFTVSPTTIHQNDQFEEQVLNDVNREAVTPDRFQHDSQVQSIPSGMARRRSSVFEGIPLKTAPKDHDSRYGKSGKFWFDNEREYQLKDIPDLMSKSKKRPPSSGSDTSFASSRCASDASSPMIVHEPLSNKRTWTQYHPESPAQIQIVIDEINQEQIDSDTNSLISVVEASTGEDPFIVQVEPISGVRKRPNYTAQKTLMVAQMLVDQVSQASLLRREYNMQLHRVNGSTRIDISMDHTGTRLPINHASLADITTTPARTTSKVLTISSRLICVHRADIEIAARPSILPFWDILGLQPYNDPKDVTAFCIHPGSSNVSEGCATLLSRLADTYGSCNLGTHSVGRFAGLTNDGLLAWSTQPNTGPNLKHLCQRLGSTIGSSGSSESNTIVVYMISPSKDSLWYRELCHAFTILFEAFVDTSEGIRKDTELVLQVVPLDFVALPNTLAVPNQNAYLELAFEVYNRVPVGRVDMAMASCGSAVVLENHQTRDPYFELSKSTISPLSKDGPCLHLAYSYTPDKRWLVAAWTDERGLIAFTMSYCLVAAHGGKTRSKREVFRSIWDISHDVMNRSRVKWRLVVVHDSFYDAEDIGEWQYLISQEAEDPKTMIRLLLLSAELNPEIIVEIPVSTAKTVPPPTVSQVPNISGTPVSTPQGQMTSPDQIIAATPTSGSVQHSNTVATPPDHSLESGQDTETMLIDPADQSWGATLGFGFNQSSKFTEVRPAAASGLLIKRTGSKDDSKALQLLGIDLVAVPRSPPTSLSISERESILQDIMEQYRGLVTLAVSRGCIDRSNDLVPWHIATAVKGVRVLSEAM